MDCAPGEASGRRSHACAIARLGGLCASRHRRQTARRPRHQGLPPFGPKMCISCCRHEAAVHAWAGMPTATMPSFVCRRRPMAAAPPPLPLAFILWMKVAALYGRPKETGHHNCVHAGAVVVLAVIGLLAVGAAFNSAINDDDLRLASMAPDERQDELRGMLNGEKGINCGFLSDADDHAEGVLGIGTRGDLTWDEVTLWRDVRDLYRISGC